MKFWLSGEFKRLQKEWNEKLSQSGFYDVEKTIGGDRALKRSTNNICGQVPAVVREAKVAYYNLLAHYFRKESFRSPRDAVVMARYIEGMKFNQIVEHCREAGIKIERKTVRFTVRRYECKWGIKEWTMKEQNLRKALVTA